MRILLRARNSLLSSTTSFASHKRRRPSTLKVVEVEQKNLASEEPLRIPSTSGTSTDFVDFVLDKYRSELQQLSVSLKKHVEADRAGLQKTSGRRKHILNCLRKALVGSSDRLVVPVGSTGSGTAGLNSDLDVVLISSLDADKRARMMKSFSNENFRTSYMRKVQSAVKENDTRNEFDWEKSLMLWKVRVPVVRLSTRVGIDVDIQFDNEHSIRNTNFVRHCVQQDARVSLLNAWAQRWMMAMRLKNSRIGMFSSYHTTMLAIHFLQCAQYASGPVLPAMYELHSDKLSRLLPIKKVAEMIDAPVVYTSLKDNRSPHIAEIIVRFIDFYSKIDLHEYALSVESGQIVQRDDDLRDLLMIHDPYSTETICNVHAGAERLMQAFAVTKEAMMSGMGLNWPIRMRKR
uniref:Poly(A) RNA polymerase gld-2 A n=1 Tax=Ascaris suum TaxID=6253 RepID=F1L3U2_ASCSU